MGKTTDLTVVGSLLFVLMLISLIPNHVLALSADEIVYDTTQEVLQRLESEQQALERDPAQIKQIVRELIVPHMDFTMMTAMTLSSDWKQLDHDLQTCVSAGFRNLLIERYAYVLLAYRNQNISYQSAIPEARKDYISITQTLTRPETKPLTIKYPMRPDGDSWKVVDLVIDNVSLVKTYKKIFARKVKHQGIFGFSQSFSECSVIP